MSPLPRKKTSQKPHNTNQCNNFWCSLKKDFIVKQKTDAEVNWEACRSQASTYGATIHRPASSIHSPVHSVPECDYILANSSQKMSYGTDTRKISGSHWKYFSVFCNLAPLSQFSPIGKISFSLFPSHVQASACFFQFAHVSWYSP